MTKLFGYLKPYWFAVIAAPLLMLLEVVTDLWQPTMMAKIVDVGIANRDLDFVLKNSLVMIGIALVGVIGGLGCTVAAAYVSQNFATDLRADLFKKVQSFSFAEVDRFHTASLITRLTNDVSQVQNMLLMGLRIMVRAPLLSVGGITMILILNVKLSWTLLLCMPILVIMLVYIIKKGFPLFGIVQQKLDRLNGVVRGNLSGVRLVKAYVRETREKERFEESNSELMQVSVKASRIIALMMPVMMLVMNMAVVLVLWFGGRQVISGNITVGEIIAFTNYMTQILFSLMMIAFVLMAVSRAKVSANRISEVLNTEVMLKDLPDAVDEPLRNGSVVFENVCFHYPGSKGADVLKNVSFIAEPGQMIAVLGSTGSGKSTLVNLIPRFYDVTAGRILIDGKDIRTIRLTTLRKKIGMVLQESILFSGSIKENLRWGDDDASGKALIHAAQAAQADEFVKGFADGYDTLMGQRGVNVSGGQKQRLSIARALVRKPKILILDDSTSAVDIRTEALIQKALKTHMKDCTTFIIAQRISSVMQADKIIVLEDGRIVAEGTHQNLLKTNEIYRDIYESQGGKVVM